MSSIELSGLSVVFPDGFAGLDAVDLHVEPEEFIALVGPSGSGKTTLLRTLAGFLTPTSGELRIGGADMTDIPPEYRRIGMVFQQHAVWPHMSVAGNVAYPLKRMKSVRLSKTERIARVERALSLVGLDGFASRRPSSLSGGQRQRVALARAIIADPSVLLLDEALSALDEPLRDALRRELVALTRREGLTTVHVTHDRSEALSIADRIVVLDSGQIQQIASPEELITRPATPGVAAFIADATILSGTASGGTVTCGEFTWSGMEVEDGPVSVAVLPESVTVASPGTPGSVRATVTSVLFDSHSFSLTVEDSAGTRYRCSVPGARPEIGEAVGIRVHSPLLYPAHDQVDQTADASSSA